MLIWLGLFGLVASFHGIILGYSRQIYALGREGYLPAWLAKLHPRFRTPHRAILAGGVVGIIAIFSDQYAVRRPGAHRKYRDDVGVRRHRDVHHQHPLAVQAEENGARLARPFRAPLYPFFPGFSLVAAIVCLVTMIYYNREVALLFAAFMALGYAHFLMTREGARTMRPSCSKRP